MKPSIKLLFTLLLILIFSNQLRASDAKSSDSLKISHIVSDFYSWYLNAIINEKYSEYMPRFVANESGMTTIEHSNYIKNLKKYHLTDSLIMKEIRSYEKCIGNLKGVKYADFGKNIFLDLDEFERAQCDFGNYYRWTGGQEPIGGIRITSIKYLNADNALVTIDYYDVNDKVSDNFYGENKVVLIKIKNHWYIDSVDSWNNIVK